MKRYILQALVALLAFAACTSEKKQPNIVLITEAVIGERVF